MSSINFLGDVWLPRPFVSKIPAEGPFVFNLESPITSATTPAAVKVCLRARRSYISQTFHRDPIAVCLANNHIMDYGPQGFADTLAALGSAGISHFGAGELSRNCGNPLLLEVSGTRLALLGYVSTVTHPIFATRTSPGVTPPVLETVDRDLKLARAKGASLAIVHLHWGIEETHLPRPDDVELGRAIIHLGADAIIGHHAHCIQSTEIHQRKPIYYGLGNCIFPDVHITGPGHTPEVSRKTQRNWNRRSLMATLDCQSSSFTQTELIFTGSELRAQTCAQPLQPLACLADPHYERRFRRHWRFSMFRLALARYLSEPRLPRAHHWRLLWRLLAPQTREAA